MIKINKRTTLPKRKLSKKKNSHTTIMLMAHRNTLPPHSINTNTKLSKIQYIKHFQHKKQKH